MSKAEQFPQCQCTATGRLSQEHGQLGQLGQLAPQGLDGNLRPAAGPSTSITLGQQE